MHISIIKFNNGLRSALHDINKSKTINAIEGYRTKATYSVLLSFSTTTPPIVPYYTDILTMLAVFRSLQELKTACFVPNPTVSHTLCYDYSMVCVPPKILFGFCLHSTHEVVQLVM
jgi:hypothetical protein